MLPYRVFSENIYINLIFLIKMKLKKFTIFIIILISLISNISFWNNSNQNKKTLTNEQISW